MFRFLFYNKLDELCLVKSSLCFHSWSFLKFQRSFYFKVKRWWSEKNIFFNKKVFYLWCIKKNFLDTFYLRKALNMLLFRITYQEEMLSYSTMTSCGTKWFMFPRIPRIFEWKNHVLLYWEYIILFCFYLLHTTIFCIKFCMHMSYL